MSKNDGLNEYSKYLLSKITESMEKLDLDMDDINKAEALGELRAYNKAYFKLHALTDECE